MKVTKEQLESKIFQAQQDNQKGWLDTEKMNKFGIITSQPLRLTGYEPKENMFQSGQTKKPYRGY